MRVLPILLCLEVILAGAGDGIAVEKETPRLTMEQVRESAERIDAALLEVVKGQQQEGTPVVAVPPVVSDEVFLRRLMVDVAGRLPTMAEVREFTEEDEVSKRERWAEKVTASQEASRWRFRRMADVLRVKDEASGISLRPYIEWLKGEVARDAPYDVLVKRLLEAQGTLKEDPAGGYLLTDGTELRMRAGETMRALLGMDIQCAACHDDPFGDTSQRQFHAFAGAFNRVVEDNKAGLRLAAEPTLCRLPENYQYRDGKPGEVVPIAALPSFDNFGPNMKAKSGEWKPEEARTALSEWVAGETNVQFQEVAALRVWEWMFGRIGRLYLDSSRLFATEAPEEMMSRMHDCAAVGPGLGSPVGLDWRPGQAQASFVAVLREEWNRCGRRMGEFQRVLAHTQGYQREGLLMGDNRLMTRSFLPAPTVRRLPAEVIFGSLMKWSGKQNQDELPEVVPMDHPLRLLGRGGRVWSDSDGAPVSHEMVRFLINSDLIDAVSALPLAFRERGVEGWYQTILGRTPSPSELRLAKSYVEINRESGMGDVVWALINTSEFVFQQ